MDAADRTALDASLRRAMSSAATPAALDAALVRLGWPELLTEVPDVAVPSVFRLLGETGACAPVLNDVVRHEAGLAPGGTIPLPFAGGAWVVWPRGDEVTDGLDPGLPLVDVAAGDAVPLRAGRLALGWWLTGTSRRMLTLARDHALGRAQFGRPVASFQAVRHRLAETLVAVEGAESTLLAADDTFGALLAKAAAGRAAVTAAKHCQQVLGGMGFTAEHEFHRHARRALTLDCLLGSSRELIREAGEHLLAAGSAPRLAPL
jgi:hypothetical protein